MTPRLPQTMVWDGRLGQPPPLNDGSPPLDSWTRFPAWGEIWLSAFRAVGTVRGACQLAQVDRTSYYRYAKSCPAFAEAVAHAREDIIDGVEQVVLQLALQDRSLKACLAMLRAYRPERWAPIPVAAPGVAAPDDPRELRERLRIKAGLPALPGAPSPPAGPPLIGEILDDRDPPDPEDFDAGDDDPD